MGKSKKNKEKKQETVRESEPELKIIREIKPEIVEITEEFEEQEDFIPEFKEESVSPVLEKIDLEQTLSEVELPKKDKEEKDDEIKYVEEAPKYTPGPYEEESEKEKERRRDSGVMKIERFSPERNHRGFSERELREKPVRFVDDNERFEEVMKYENIEPESTGADLPFSTKAKKYKRKI